MRLLIRSAKIIDSESPFNGLSKDIYIENGIISSIADHIPTMQGVEEVSENGLHVSPGWFDMQVSFGEPGHEFKEDIESGCNAAVAGGITSLLLMPDTSPVNDQKGVTELLHKKAEKFPVHIYTAAALSKNCEGKELSEMYDLHLAGNVAFTDSHRTVRNSKLLQLALLYSSQFKRLIIHKSDDTYISGNGLMNEGEISAQTGLKGIPEIAEETGILRDLALAEYSHTSIHLTAVTSKKSIENVKNYQSKGLIVSCSVPVHHLFFTDEDLVDFNSNHKVNPPYRGKESQKAIYEALMNGTIEVICSDHQPEDAENKVIEFDKAAYGIIGLETLFAAANTALKSKMTLAQIIDMISRNPRRILGIDVPQISEGHRAEITLFNPNENWTYLENQIRSKSKNTPFINFNFSGKALGIVSKGRYLKS